MSVKIYARLASKGWRGQVVERNDNPRVLHHVHECHHAHRSDSLALRCARQLAAKRYPGTAV